MLSGQDMDRSYSIAPGLSSESLKTVTTDQLIKFHLIVVNIPGKIE